MAQKSIGEYGIIGNSHTAALVSNEGSIDWCCLPRFDSPSIFAAILDNEKGGRFHIKPQMPFQSHQAYLPNTNILQITFQTETGTVSLIDFMPCYQTAKPRLTQFHEIHRLVDCTEGEMALEAVFEPKLDYARGDTLMSTTKYGILVKGMAETLALSTSVPLALHGDSAIGRFTLQQGQRAEFVLRYGSEQPQPPGIYHSASKLARTQAYWEQQAEGCTCSSPWREAIVRSYLTLHLLLYSPTGAIVAAPTTSLPEQIGGERNWDYRFTWLRDASWTLDAFFRLGHMEDVTGFMKWLVMVCRKCGAKTQILYNIDFEAPPTEEELPHLRGYRDSRPVRIGNDAYRQIQLDVFGEVLEAAHSYLNIGGRITRRTWGLLESFVNAACDNWQLPDSGIWEVRSGPYHFVHSKLMCWVAVDRGVKIAEKLGHQKNLRRWQKAAQDIRDSILTRGWNAERQAFTQHYDTQALDASNLLMPLYGFLPISDERITATIERTVAELSRDGLMLRYRTEETNDGLSGEEGAFLWCSFWLVRNLLRLDRLEEATALYQRLLSYSNHLGLFSEMVDPTSGETLGNFPQALTHLAVIITGLELTHAIDEKKTSSGKQ